MRDDFNINHIPYGEQKLGIHIIITYSLLLLPRLHGRFVFLEFVTPVGVNFLIVIAFVRWRTSGKRIHIMRREEVERERGKKFNYFYCNFFEWLLQYCGAVATTREKERKELMLHMLSLSLSRRSSVYDSFPNLSLSSNWSVNVSLEASGETGGSSCLATILHNSSFTALTYERRQWCCSCTAMSHPNSNRSAQHRPRWRRPQRDHAPLCRYILSDYISPHNCVEDTCVWHVQRERKRDTWVFMYHRNMVWYWSITQSKERDRRGEAGNEKETKDLLIN